MKVIKNLMEILVKIFFTLPLFNKKNKNKNVEKIFKLYESDNFSNLFTKIRFWDAPLVEIEKYVPKNGTIVDLGCGDGVLANYLSLSSNKRNIFGIEINKDRIKEADKGLKNTSFKYGNILKADFSKADAILLIHVLHHLPSYKDQEKLIAKCIGNLKKDGILIIVEIIEKPFFKYLFTWITDVITVPILFGGKLFDLNIFYRKEKDWKTLLNGYDLSVKSIREHKGMPFSHVIFICKKR